MAAELIMVVLLLLCCSIIVALLTQFNWPSAIGFCPQAIVPTIVVSCILLKFSHFNERLVCCHHTKRINSHLAVDGAARFFGRTMALQFLSDSSDQTSRTKENTVFCRPLRMDHLDIPTCQIITRGYLRHSKQMILASLV